MTGIRRRIVRSAVLLAVVALLYLLFVVLPIGQRVDDLGAGLPAWLDAVTGIAVLLRTPLLVLSLAGAAVVIVDALTHRRVVPALTGVAVIGVAGLVNSFLRDVALSRPDLGSEAGFDGNSFPSGHAAVSVAAASVMIALWRWPRPRGMIAGIAAVPALVALSSVLAHAHRVSDVIAGALLGGAISQWIAGTSVPSMPRVARWLWTCVAIIASLSIGGTLAVVDTVLDAMAPPLFTVGVVGVVASATALVMLVAPQPSPDVSASVLPSER